MLSFFHGWTSDRDDDAAPVAAIAQSINDTGGKAPGASSLAPRRSLPDARRLGRSARDRVPDRLCAASAMATPALRCRRSADRSPLHSNHPAPNPVDYDRPCAAAFGPRAPIPHRSMSRQRRAIGMRCGEAHMETGCSIARRRGRRHRTVSRWRRDGSAGRSNSLAGDAGGRGHRRAESRAQA